MVIVVVGIVGVFELREYLDSPKVRAAAVHAEAARRAADADKEHAVRMAESERAQKFAKLKADAAVYSVQQLVSAYEANEVACDEAMKGRWLKVEGRVDRVGKDLLDSMYVAFQCDNNSIRTVQCLFDDSHKSELAQLRPGTRIVIFGRGAGLMGNVLLDRCEIVNGN